MLERRPAGGAEKEQVRGQELGDCVTDAQWEVKEDQRTDSCKGNLRRLTTGLTVVCGQLCGNHGNLPTSSATFSDTYKTDCALLSSLADEEL